MTSGYHQLTVKIFSLTAFIVFTLIGRSQEYSYKQYTVEDGLAQNQVINFFQDQAGYLWIATKGGVSRFDGVEFSNYTVNDGLLSNQVLDVFEDQLNGINIVTSLGISRLYNDTITTTFLQDTLSVKNLPYLIYPYSKNDLCIINSRGSVMFYDTADSFKLELLNKVLKLNPTYIRFDEGNKLFWVQTTQLQLLVVSMDTIIPYHKPLNGSFLKAHTGEIVGYDRLNFFRFNDQKKQFETISSLPQVPDGILYIAYNNATFYLRTKYNNLVMVNDSVVTKLPYQFNYINNVMLDRDCNLWIATETGLIRLINKVFKNFTAKSGINEYVWSFVEDESGNIWFASYGDGLGI